MSSAGSPAWQSSQSITAASPSLVDDQVAEPEVAVDERVALGRRRRVEPQPAQARLDRRAAARRSRRAPPPRARTPRSPGRRRRRRGPRPRRGRPSGSAPAPSPSCAGQPLARRRELVAPQDPRRHRGARDELHQVAGAVPRRPPAGSNASGRRAPRRRPRSAAAIAAQLDARAARTTSPPGGLAAQHPARLAAGLDQERLARRAALDRAQLELARVLAGASARTSRTAVRRRAAQSPRSSPWRAKCRSGMSAGSLYQYQVHGSRSKSSGGSDGIDRMADPADRQGLVHERAVGAVEREALAPVAPVVRLVGHAPASGP